MILPCRVLFASVPSWLGSFFLDNSQKVHQSLHRFALGNHSVAGQSEKWGNHEIDREQQDGNVIPSKDKLA